MAVTVIESKAPVSVDVAVVAATLLQRSDDHANLSIAQMFARPSAETSTILTAPTADEVTAAKILLAHESLMAAHTRRLKPHLCARKFIKAAEILARASAAEAAEKVPAELPVELQTDTPIMVEPLAASESAPAAAPPPAEVAIPMKLCRPCVTQIDALPRRAATDKDIRGVLDGLLELQSPKPQMKKSPVVTLPHNLVPDEAIRGVLDGILRLQSAKPPGKSPLLEKPRHLITDDAICQAKKRMANVQAATAQNDARSFNGSESIVGGVIIVAALVAGIIGVPYSYHMVSSRAEQKQAHMAISDMTPEERAELRALPPPTTNIPARPAKKPTAPEPKHP